jgi:hypothetical protein
VTYQVFTSIKEVASTWDGILPINHHLQSSYLSAIEDSRVTNAQYYYLLVYNKSGELIGGIYYQLIRFSQVNYQYPASRIGLLKWLEKQLMNRGFRILVCGNLLCVNAPGFYTKPSSDFQAQVFTAMIEFENSLKPKPDAVLLKDLPLESNVNALILAGYKPWQSDLTMKLSFPPGIESLENYVSMLRHRYSQKFRRARRHLQPIERREIRQEELSNYADRIYELYRNVVMKQAVRMIIVGPLYWIKLKKSLKDRFRVFGYFKAGKLVAFSSNIIHDSHWELHYIGLDYSENNRHLLYFNLLYDAVGDCLLSGRRELELGRTARETKAILGATPVYFTNYIKIKNAIAKTMTSSIKANFEKINLEISGRINPFRAKL